MKIASRHRKERTFFRLGQTNYRVLSIVNRENVVVSSRKQRSDCAHFVEKQLIENAVKAVKPASVVILLKSIAEREKLRMQNVDILFILGLAQLKFKSIAIMMS